ncbi:MAG: hydrogenase maturation nickel metallochaperone HypA [Bacteroidota bacterium]|jgi:hydrogenase nickel incorporation protein HypA/HybF
MHELSIAQNIVEIVQQNVPELDWPKVRSVVTIVGEQSGVVPDSLQFSYHAITASTRLEHSELDIEPVPFTIHCIECGVDSLTDQGSVQCPVCGMFATTIIAGTELSVREIKMDESYEVKK